MDTFQRERERERERETRNVLYFPRETIREKTLGSTTVAFHSTSVLFQQSFDAEEYTYDTVHESSRSGFHRKSSKLLFPRDQRRDIHRGAHIVAVNTAYVSSESKKGSETGWRKAIPPRTGVHFAREIFIESDITERAAGSSDVLLRNDSVPLEITGGSCSSRRRIER